MKVVGWRSPSGAISRRPATAGGEPTMTNDQKVIRNKVGQLELAKQLGNVSQACKIMVQP